MITENTHKQKSEAMSSMLQINPLEDNYPFQTTFRLFWVFSNFVLNIFSLHRQHLLSLSFCGRKIGVV